MGPILFQIAVILAVVGFLAYLAYDDRRNQKLREEEDRIAEQENSKDS